MTREDFNKKWRKKDEEREEENSSLSAPKRETFTDRYNRQQAEKEAKIYNYLADTINKSYSHMNDASDHWQDSASINRNKNEANRAHTTAQNLANKYKNNENIRKAYEDYNDVFSDYDFNKVNERYSKYLTEDAYNKDTRKNEFANKYSKGLSYEEWQNALKSVTDEEERDYLKTYTNFKSNADFDKAIAYARDVYEQKNAANKPLLTENFNNAQRVGQKATKPQNALITNTTNELLKNDSEKVKPKNTTDEEYNYMQNLKNAQEVYNRFNAFDEYKDLMNRPDFNEKSDPTAIINAENEYGLMTMGVKHNKDAFKDYDESVLKRGALSQLNGVPYLMEMNEDMQRVGAYIYNTDESPTKEAYKEFLRKVAIQSSAETSAEKEQQRVEYSTQNLGTGLGMTLANTLARPAQNLGATLEAAVSHINSAVTGNEYNPYYGMAGWGRQINASQQALSQAVEDRFDSDIGKTLARIGYNAATEGLTSRIGQASTGGLYNIIMGGGIYAQTYGDALLSGMTKEQAEGKALAAGAIETLTEQIGMEGAFGWIPDKAWWLNGLKQRFAEGAEEVVGNLANLLYDNWANGKKSEFEGDVQAYMTQGYTEGEARKMAAWKFALQTLEEAATASISAGISSNVQAFSTAQTGKNIDFARLGQAVNTYSPDSETAKAYNNLLGKYTEADKVPNWNKGIVARQAYNEALNQYNQAVKSNDSQAMDNARMNRIALEEAFKTNDEVKAERENRLLNKAVQSVKSKIQKDTSTKVDETKEYTKDEMRKALDQSYLNKVQDGYTELEKSLFNANVTENLPLYKANFDYVANAAHRQTDLEEVLQHVTTSAMKHSTAIDIYNQIRANDAELGRIATEANSKLISKWDGEYSKKGTLTVDVDKKNLTKEDKRILGLVTVLTHMGMDINVIKNKKEENGWITSGDNKITLNLAATYSTGKDQSKGTYVINTLAHETTHWIENILGKAEFGNFKNLIRSSVGQAKWDEMVGLEISRAKEAGADLSTENAESEAMARFCEDMFTDMSVVDRVFENASRSQIERLAQAIKDFFTKIRDDLKAWIKSANYSSESNEARLLREMESAFKQAQEEWGKLFERALAVNQVVEAVKDVTEDYTEEKNEVKQFSTKVSIENGEELMARHNVGQEQLLKTIKLGGFALPSIAIMKKYTPHDRFGDCTVVFAKATIDPRYKNNPVYSGDAYTPIFPTIDKKISREKQQAIEDKVEELVGGRDIYYKTNNTALDYENMTDKLNRFDVVSSYNNNDVLKYAFLQDTGNGFKMPMVEKVMLEGQGVSNNALGAIALTLGDDVINEMHEGGYRWYEAHPEIVDQIRLALNEAYIKENDVPFNGEDEGKAFKKKMIDQHYHMFDDEENGKLSWHDYEKVARAMYIYRTRGASQIIDTRKFEDMVKERVDQQAYEKWLTKLFDGIIEKEGIRNNKDIFTASGNRRSWEALHDEVNLENVVKKMLKEESTGIGMMGSNIFGASTRRYTSIEDIHKDVARLILQDEAERDRIRAELSDKLHNLVYEVVGNESDTYSALRKHDDVYSMFCEAIRKSRTVEGINNYLQKESKGFYTVKDDVASKLLDIAKQIEKMPTEYFEAKPTRAVDLGEIAYVVIPSDANKDLIKALKDNNIAYHTYEKGNNENRLKVTNENANIESGTLFSRRVEMPTSALEKANYYTYENLTNLPDVHVVKVEGKESYDRKKLKEEANNNCLKNGYEKNGKIYTHVDRLGMDVRVSDKAWNHGMDRRIKVISRVMPNIGDILKNSILVNELNPRDTDTTDTYVLIGVAQDKDNRYIISFVVNKRTKQIESINELYSASTKKDSAAFPPEFSDRSESLTESFDISVSDVLDAVNKLYPDILPEDVLRHYGNKQRPEGKIGESALYSRRVDSNGNTLSEGQEKYFEKSVVRDANGNLLVVYHGTPRGGFTVFRNGLIYFTANKEYADRYTRVNGSSQRGNSPKIYEGYLNITKPFDVTNKEVRKIFIDEYIKGGYAQGINPMASQKEINDYVNRGIDWVEADNLKDFIDEKRYDFDGIILNEGGDLTENGTVMRGNSYVAFSSEQFKDINNQNPTDNKDINYSRRVKDTTYELLNQTKRLEKENQTLKNDVKNLKKLLSLQSKVTKGEILDDKKLVLAARTLLKDANSKYSVQELTNDLRDLYGYILENSSREDAEIHWDEIMDRAYNISSKVLGEQKPYKWVDDYYNGILKDIRSARIKLTDTQVQEAKNAFGSNYRESLFGRIFTTNEGRSLDSYWSEWAGNYPDVFDEEVSEGDQITRLSEIYDSLNDSKEILQYFNTVEDTKQFANEIYNKFWTVSTLNTVADKYEKEINKLKFEHRQAMAEIKESKEKALADLRKHKNEVIKNIREDRDKKMEEYKNLVKEREKQHKERAERKVYIERIKDTSEDLLKKLNKNSLKDPIIKPLQNLVSDFISSIDFSSSRSLGLSGGENLSGQATKKDQAFMQALKGLRSFITGEELEKDLAEIRDYVFLANDDFGLGEYFANKWKKFTNRVMELSEQRQGENFYILNMMSVEELQELAQLMKELKSVVSEANNLIGGANGMMINELRSGDIADLNELGRAKDKTKIGQNAYKFFNWSNSLPEYAMKHIGKGISIIFNEMKDGMDKEGFLQRDIRNFAKETFIKERNADEEDIKTIELGNESFQMTAAQVMDLYVAYKREQAKPHINEGGIRVSKFKNEGGKESDRIEEHKLSDAQVEYITKKYLTQEQRDRADKMQKWLSDFSKKNVNEVTLKMAGIEIADDPNYWAIEVVKKGQKEISEKAREQGIYRLINSSFANPLMENAQNPIVIRSIYDAFIRTASETAKYNAYALPMRDMIKYITQENYIGNGERESIYDALHNVYGDAAYNYVIEFLKDLGGLQQAGRGEEYVAHRNYKISQVGANLQVAVLQPVSISRAALVIDRKYLIASVASAWNIKHGIETMHQNSGVSLIKESSTFDINLSRGLNRELRQMSIKDKIDEASTALANTMDKVTWGAIWNACEMEYKAKNGKLTEEGLKEVNKRFREIIFKTQVMDSVMTRSDLMRSQSKIVQMFTSFMSESTVTFNMVQDSAFDWDNDRRKYGTNEALRRNGKRMAKVIEIYCVNAILEGLVRGLIGKWRDKDDEENELKYWWSYISEQLDPLSNIPLVRDVVSLVKGYDVNRMDLQPFATAVKTLQRWSKIRKGDKDIDYKTVYSTLQTISQFTGIPISNAMREVIDIWNNFIGRAYPSLHID